MIWKKCFNQVYASEGMSEFDDYIQIVPLVKWQKRSTTDRLFEAIDNSYHVVQAHSGDSDLVLPKGWLFGESSVSMCEEVCELARHGSLQLRRSLSKTTLCRYPMNSS